ncbi:MAG: LptF/LptG family permease [Candidatus Kapabacteria bacterium]|nr:LptF/LptG family permease [Candidatus Kapabacteria bacterium]
MRTLLFYILRQIIATLIFSLVALSVIFIVVNYLDNLDKFLDDNAPTFVVVMFYLHSLPEILKILTPVGTLSSVLFVIGKLTTNNEITAMKSGGLSLYKLMVPILFFGVILSVGQVYFSGWIVPIANQKKNLFEQKYMRKAPGGQIYNLYFRDSSTKNININFYDPDKKTGNKVVLEEFTNEKTPRLIKRLEADEMKWDSISMMWILKKITKRDFINDKVELVHIDSTKVKLNISHSQIANLRRSEDELNFDERRDYIELMRTGGKDVRRDMIDYYGDWAFPFANFIVILFGVPFASIKKKGGMAVQITAALLICLFYLIFTKVSQSIGYSIAIPAQLSAWSANIIFFVIGIFNLFKTRT